MPNRDGTGPHGDGRPGRGLGNCGRSSSSLQGTRQSADRSVWASGAELVVDIIKALMAKNKTNKRS